MTSAFKKRAISLTLAATAVFGFALLRPRTTDAVVVPPTFVASLLQALPGVEGVVAKIFKKDPGGDTKKAINKAKDDSNVGKTQLSTYAQREQVIWRLVSSSSLVSRAVAGLTVATSTKTTLTAGEAASLATPARFIHDGVAGIVKSGPKSKLFEPDTTQMSAIDDLLNKAPTMTDAIQEDLKYDKDPSVEQARVTDLHTQLAALDNIFSELDKATAAEIEMIADGLSTVSTPDTNPKDATKVKEAADADSKNAFTDVTLINAQIQKLNHEFDEALEVPKNQHENP
jgi:hypothetical protein